MSSDVDMDYDVSDMANVGIGNPPDAEPDINPAYDIDGDDGDFKQAEPSTSSNTKKQSSSSNMTRQQLRSYSPTRRRRSSSGANRPQTPTPQTNPEMMQDIRVAAQQNNTQYV